MYRKQIIQLGKILSTGFVLALTTSACNQLVNPNFAGKRTGVNDVSGGGDYKSGRGLAGYAQALVTGEKHPDFPNAKYLIADPSCRMPGSLGARSQANGRDIVFDNGLVQYDCALLYGVTYRPVFGRPNGDLIAASMAQATAFLKAEANGSNRQTPNDAEVLRSWSHRLSYRNDLDAQCIADADAKELSLPVFEAIAGNGDNLGSLERCRIQPFNRWNGNRVTNKQLPFGLVSKFCMSLPDNGPNSYGDTTVCERVSKYMQGDTTIQEAEDKAEAELNFRALGEIRIKCEKYVRKYNDPEFRINPQFAGDAQFSVETTEGTLYGKRTRVKCTDFIALGMPFN